jgi:AhpD family alkylhydroperoxidase
MLTKIHSLALSAVIALAGLLAVPALSADKPNQETYADIEKTLGAVPGFFELFPAAQLPGAWQTFKSVELNPDTALDAKTKQLIGLAVAVRTNCDACVYFHTSAALANGATGKELQEAVAIAVIGGDWSKVLSAHDDIVRRDTNALVMSGALKAPPTN